MMGRERSVRSLIREKERESEREREGEREQERERAREREKDPFVRSFERKREREEKEKERERKRDIRSFAASRSLRSLIREREEREMGAPVSSGAVTCGCGVYEGRAHMVVSRAPPDDDCGGDDDMVMVVRGGFLDNIMHVDK